MIWASYISPITGRRVRWRYRDGEEAARTLRELGGQPDTHDLQIEEAPPK